MWIALVSFLAVMVRAPLREYAAATPMAMVTRKHPMEIAARNPTNVKVPAAALRASKWDF